MAAHKNLTDKGIAKLAPAPRGRRVQIWDAIQPALALRITDKGKKSFSVVHRVNGTWRRWTIGQFPKVSLAAARVRASAIMDAVAQGKDPDELQQIERRAEERKRRGTVDKIVDSFMEKYAKRQTTAGSWRETERIFNVYVLPQWKGRDVDGVGRLDVAELLDGIEENNGPVMADRTLAAIRKFFNWHAARDDRFVSPVVIGMARTKPRERARVRVLSDDELRLIWPLIDDTKGVFDEMAVRLGRGAEEFKRQTDLRLARLRSVFGPLVRFLLLTGQRRDEAAGIRLDQIKQPDGGTVWDIPAERYKTKRAHAVPLSAAAHAIIEAQPRLTVEDGKPAPFVFTTCGDVPFQGFGKSKLELDGLVRLRQVDHAGKHQIPPADVPRVPNWTLHDLRRTAKTLMIRGGVRPDITERVLGHVIPGVSGVYDRHDYLAEKREALNVLAGVVGRILDPTSAAIVPLRARA